VLWSLLHYLWYLTLIKDRCIIRGINPCTSTEQPRIFVDQNYKSLFLAWHQWLIPVILATHSSKPAWENSSSSSTAKKKKKKFISCPHQAKRDPSFLWLVALPSSRIFQCILWIQLEECWEKQKGRRTWLMSE
jgi:hypothetical protein